MGGSVMKVLDVLKECWRWPCSLDSRKFELPPGKKGDNELTLKIKATIGKGVG